MSRYALLIMILTPTISTLLSLALALIAIAFYTLIERKFLGYHQLRKGPNKPRIAGLPQPFADAIKLFLKEQAKPTMSNSKIFLMAPTIRLGLALIM
jgi:NADH-ubiquinone oxidoreductase chain 1